MPLKQSIRLSSPFAVYVLYGEYPEASISA
jgi:hypothetical protein